jgi:hypothetical protein
MFKSLGGKKTCAGALIRKVENLAEPHQELQRQSHCSQSAEASEDSLKEHP